MKPEMKTGTIWRNAKDCLKRYYWNGFGVAILFTIILSVVETATSYINSGFSTLLNAGGNALANLSQFDDLNVTTTWTGVIINAVIAIVATVLITFIVNVCECRYFAASRYGACSLDNAFAPFKGYADSLKMSLRYALYAQQWRIYTLPVMVAAAALSGSNPSLSSALSSVGNIVMSIGTLIVSLKLFCVPYIYAENPDIDPKRAIELSFSMTDGYMGKIFGNLLLCGLVAIGGACCCFVGLLFVIPYIYAVKAEIYTFLSEIAKQSGITDSTELPGYAPAGYYDESSERNGENGGYTPVDAIVSVPTQIEPVYSNEDEYTQPLE